MKFHPGERVIVNGNQHLGHPWHGKGVWHAVIAHGRHHHDCEPSYQFTNGQSAWQSQLRKA